MPAFVHRLTFSFVIAALAASCACGGLEIPELAESEVSESSLTIRGKLAPQSFVRDTITDSRPQVAWSFTGAADDVVAPDVWPTPSTTHSNTLVPRITLLGPARNGKRPVLATGHPRNEDDRHQAIDGFKLPKAGTYVVVVAQDAAGRVGELTLRFWTSASKAPRPEKAQIDLKLQPSETMTRILDARRPGGSRAFEPWTDEQVDAAISLFFVEPDPVVAFSDAEQLLLHLEHEATQGRATREQHERARRAASALVGRPSQFASLTPQQQAFGLFWLGHLTRAVFEAEEISKDIHSPTLRNVRSQIDALIASWPGSRERGDRVIRAFHLGGATYGYVVEWMASQDERDGTPIFLWSSTDYFDKNGRWLGQQSFGATEPDDD